MKIIVFLCFWTLLTHTSSAQLRKNNNPVKENSGKSVEMTNNPQSRAGIPKITKTKKPANFEWEGETTEVKGVKAEKAQTATIPTSGATASNSKKNKKINADIKKFEKNKKDPNAPIKGSTSSGKMPDFKPSKNNPPVDNPNKIGKNLK